jgi:hypothetical protein
MDTQTSCALLSSAVKSRSLTKAARRGISNPCARINVSAQPSGQRASKRSARTRSAVAAGNYRAPNVVALDKQHALDKRRGNVPTSFPT